MATALEYSKAGTVYSDGGTVSANGRGLEIIEDILPTGPWAECGGCLDYVERDHPSFKHIRSLDRIVSSELEWRMGERETDSWKLLSYMLVRGQSSDGTAYSIPDPMDCPDEVHCVRKMSFVHAALQGEVRVGLEEGKPDTVIKPGQFLLVAKTALKHHIQVPEGVVSLQLGYHTQRDFTKERRLREDMAVARVRSLASYAWRDY